MCRLPHVKQNVSLSPLDLTPIYFLDDLVVEQVPLAISETVRHVMTHLMPCQILKNSVFSYRYQLMIVKPVAIIIIWSF